MKILVDTNVILDVLCARKEFLNEATIVFKLCETKKINGYVSALSIPNIMYIMRKELDVEKVKGIVKNLSLIFNIVDLKKEDINKTINSNFKDFEDGLQSVAAKRIKADYIVTRNVDDFKYSKVKAITPKEFINTHVQTKTI